LSHKRKKKEKNTRVLVLLAGGVLIIAMILGVVIPLFQGVATSKHEINTEGVFIYINGKWERINLGQSPWVPPDNSSYLVYFKNTQCPHCKEFDPIWGEYVDKYASKDNVTPVQIVCTWFTQQCTDPTAYASFSAYRVPFSPALMVVYNMSIIYYGPAAQNVTGVHDIVVNAFKQYYNQTNQTTTT